MIRALPALLLVAVVGCGTSEQVGDAVDDENSDQDFFPDLSDGNTYEDCPEVGPFEFSLEWDPDPGFGAKWSTGVILEASVNPTDILEITVELTAGDHDAGEYTFSTTLPPDVSVDLHPDDEVSVMTHDLTACGGCWILELMITRDDELVIYALDCWNEICNLSSFGVGPLLFHVIRGICPPWYASPSDDLWCFVKERVGLDVSCLDSTGIEQNATLFEGYSTALDCGIVYHVAAGAQIRVVASPEDEGWVCHDHTQDVRQLLVIRSATP